jgi:hypothetical protein
MTTEERTWQILREAEDITPEIEKDIEDCVGWFEDSPTMGTQEFIDRLCTTYGGSGRSPGDWDIDSYDNAAVRKIMRIARPLWREARS